MNTATMPPRAGDSGPCPHCLDWCGPVPIRDDREPACCPVCGRVPVVVRIRRVANFYEYRRQPDAGREGE
jgi:hypothetical protein